MVHYTPMSIPQIKRLRGNGIYNGSHIPAYILGPDGRPATTDPFYYIEVKGTISGMSAYYFRKVDSDSNEPKVLGPDGNPIKHKKQVIPQNLFEFVLEDEEGNKLFVYSENMDIGALPNHRAWVPKPGKEVIVKGYISANQTIL